MSKMGNTWNFENYDGENIKMEGEEHVTNRLSHSYFACKNLEIRIVGKIKCVNLEGCQKVTLIVDKCMGEVNIMNCKVIKIFTLE